MFRIDEIVPADPLQAEVVLHIRRLLRARIRRLDPHSGSFLALLFGFAPEVGQGDEWRMAAQQPQPFQAAAQIAANLQGATDDVVPLGHQPDHVERCHAYLKQRKDVDDAFTGIIATDLATLLELSKARELAAAVVRDDDGDSRPLPILIRGETGTGKELLARALHRLAESPTDRDAPFEVLHVAGMTADMLNDELFGHTRGAYTDAKADRAGRIELADRGTLLIDEVGDLPDAAQLRLLRFLQTQRVSRIGSDQDRKVRVRVIAATWRDLDHEVKEHRFRLDLLHRLRAGSDLVLPPLRLRHGAFDEVVPELLRRRGHLAVPSIARSARDALEPHDWPGNLRELVGVLDQALAFADGDTIRVEHLPTHIQRRYLSLPLHGRASGFLSDEFDGQHLDPVHASWRVAQVDASLDDVEPPPAPADAQAVVKFLTFLEDTSEEHRQVLEAVHAVTALGREHAKGMLAAEFWKQLLQISLPDVARRTIEARVVQQDATNTTRLRELERLAADVKLDRHPWLSMLNEITSTRLLSDQRENVMALFIAGYNLLKMIAPKVLDSARDAYIDGGLAGVRARIVEAFKEQEEEDEVPGDLAKLRGRPPADLTDVEWKRLADQPTQSSVRKITGYDPETIRQYLKKFGIVPRWQRGTRRTTDLAVPGGEDHTGHDSAGQIPTD